MNDFVTILLSDDIYRPVDASAKVNLVAGLESRFGGTCDGRKTAVCHCRLPQVNKVARLVDMYRAQVEESNQGFEGETRVPSP